MYFHDEEKNVFIDLNRLQMLRVHDKTELFDCETGECLILTSDAKNNRTYIAKTKYYLDDGMYRLAEFDNEDEAYAYMNMLIKKIKENAPVIECDSVEYLMLSDKNIVSE